MNDNETIRCAIYTRSASETIHQEHTKNQRARCEAFIRERGWQLAEGEYSDSGVSGLSLDRPAFTRLREDAASGKFNRVIMQDMTRLHRGDMADHTEHLIGEFRKHGVKVVFLDEELMPSDADGSKFSVDKMLAALRKFR